MEALGRLLDISAGIAPVDLNTAGATGKRVSLRNATGITIVAYVGAAGSGTEDLVFTLKQHTASTGGTSANLAVIDHYYRKNAAALAGSETWTRVAQTASATLTLAGASYAAHQTLLAIEIAGPQLSDGYPYVSLDVADPGSVARIGSVLYILHDLAVQRAPQNLVAPLS